jgi:PPOX class probable F420-dependent enzyme
VAQSVLPDPGTPFGERFRRRLRQEHLIWFVAVGSDGTPHPNPVGFLWEYDDSILTYNSISAERVKHVSDRPRVALHFDGDCAGGDILVFTGTAHRADEVPPPHQNPEWLAKYQDMMVSFCGSTEKFSERFCVPLRIRISRVRGR